MNNYIAELITEAGSRLTFQIQQPSMAKAITAAMKRLIFEEIRTISFQIYRVRG